MILMKNWKSHALTLSFVVFFACGHQHKESFNSKSWNQYVEFKGFEHRESMIESLANQYLNHGMAKTEVVNLLGEPEKGSIHVYSSEFGYLLTEDYGSDIDPVELSYFILKFKSDSTLVSIWKRTWKLNHGLTEVRYKMPF